MTDGGSPQPLRRKSRVSTTDLASSSTRGPRRRILRFTLFSLVVALVAVLTPLAFPEAFLSADQVAQVNRFFAQTGPSVPQPHHSPLSNETHSLSGGHTNNWAVLVCTSKFWFNYRHIANTLGMYRTVKRLGIPDSNIILMLADDAACNPRNKFPGNVWASTSNRLDLYSHNIEVDYRGYEVSVENLIRLLTGRLPPQTPKSKRLESDARSNIFLYMTGHGGDEFLKFQDYEEISAVDIADAIEQMWQAKRYHELFFMVDTCQANTLYSRIYSPNVLATGSSEKGQNSYSHGADDDLGVAMIDRFTNFVLQWMEGVDKKGNHTLEQLFQSYDSGVIESDPGVRSDLFRRELADVKVTDFFGGVSQVDLTERVAEVMLM